MKKYLYGHESQETAKLVDDYPWGFRLRTQKRYWIESSEKHGQRMCSQTKDPRNGGWCKPKKSTYTSGPIVLYVNEEGHVKREDVDIYKEEELREFYERHGDNLTDLQKGQLKVFLAGAIVSKKYSIYGLEGKENITPREFSRKVIETRRNLKL